MSSLFLKLLKVNAPVSTRSFLRSLKTETGQKKDRLYQAEVSFVFWIILIRREKIIFDLGIGSIVRSRTTVR